MGARHGLLALEVCGETLLGTLTLFRQTLPIRTGSCVGNRVWFSGEMRTLLYTLPYQAEGVLSLASATLTVQTEKGCFPMTGTALVPPAGEGTQA